MTLITKPDPFSNATYEEQTQLAETELASFVAAVTRLYGSEQAKVSAEDWLEESELMDSPPRSEDRNWRAVTVAAVARLANRINPDPSMSLSASGPNTKYRVSQCRR